jgi:PAS domain-containing protein
VVVEHAQKELVLILGRELASNLATPMFLVDRAGMLVYYNEPAEVLTGEPFATIGEMGAMEWGARFQPEGLDGSPLPLEEVPATVAFRTHRPSHQRLRIRVADGSQRTIAMSALPLFSREDDFAGMVAIFWENGQGADC